MKKLSLILGVFCAMQMVQAQQYNTAVGLKADWSTVDNALGELSVKHFFTKHSAFEINLGAGQRFFWIQGMYERSQSIRSGVEWYWGTGVDFGHWSRSNGGRVDVMREQGFWTGINGVAGIEYTFEYIPINLALDTGPTFRIIPEAKFGWTVGFAMRYAFRNKRKSW